jgi:hypothetical protein
MSLSSRRAGPIRRFAVGLVFALAWAAAALRNDRP